jgi:WD40 repeat protein
MNYVLHLEMKEKTLLSTHPNFVNSWDIRMRKIVSSFNLQSLIKDENIIKEKSFKKAVFSPSNNNEIYSFVKNDNSVHVWDRS